MDVSGLLAGLERQPSGEIVVPLQGKLDMSTQGGLAAALDQALEAGAVRVVADFSAVTSMSGAALLPLAVAQARAHKRGVRMAAAAVPAYAQATFRAVWPGEEVPVYASVADALAGQSEVVAPASGSGADGGWAQSLPPVDLSAFPREVPRINVQGQPVCGPASGFGRLWHKVYGAGLPGMQIGPEAVVSEWRDHFGDFWPAGNRMHLGPAGVAPGAPGVITLTVPPGMQLITGIQVAYSGPDSFVFLPVRGHMFCGLIVFGALMAGDGLEAQVQVLVRASDPLWETAMILGGFSQEDQSWFHTLSQLARHLGTATKPRLCASVVDEQRAWSESGGVIFNSAVWSGLYQAAGLLRGLGGRR